MSGDADCEEWKQQVTVAQKKVNDEGRVLAPIMTKAEKKLKYYNEKLKNIKCTTDCPTGKLPGS